jgi:cytochrome P450
MRTAVEDVELGSFTIRAGTLVIANTAAANRDLAIYDDPDRFDITRAGAPALLTFGGGIHYCLGAHLARAELAEALTTMARRMPNIRAAGSVPWKSITGISGPVSLPIEFDCAATRRQVQALTAQLFTLATTKAGPAEPPITKRARLREATNRPTRAS